MGFVLALIIGGLIGAAVLYWLQQQKIQEKENALEQSRRRIEQLEAEHEQRLREATRKLREDYQAQLDQNRDRLVAEATQKLQDDYHNQLDQHRQNLEQHYQGQIQTLQAQVQQLEAELEALQSEATASLVDESYPPVGAPSVIDETVVIPPENTVSGPEAPVVEAESSQPDNQKGTSTVDGFDRNTASIARLLPYCHQSDPQIRLQATTAIARAIPGSSRAEAQRAIPVLGTLSRDLDPAVRRAAVEALGQIRSERVIPFLRRSLRDSNLEVVQAASQAMTRFKFYPIRQPVQMKKKSPKRR